MSRGTSGLLKICLFPVIYLFTRALLSNLYNKFTDSDIIEKQQFIDINSMMSLK